MNSHSLPLYCGEPAVTQPTFRGSLHLSKVMFTLSLVPHPLWQSWEVSYVWQLFQSAEEQNQIKTQASITIQSACNQCIYVKTCINNFTSAAAFNFILMYRLESSRSPTCKETILKLLQNRCDNMEKWTTCSPVGPLDQDWSWGSSPSSAPHPSSDVPSPVWEQNNDGRCLLPSRTTLEEDDAQARGLLFHSEMVIWLSPYKVLCFLDPPASKP